MSIKTTNSTTEKLEEAFEKHRAIKKAMITLLEEINTPNMTKEKIGDRLFLIYQELK